ncbi:DUF445 domain-containing protein [Brevundimonas sp.]|uniref:DUF445 domain-containing protein n=1 Tax=Brevundimonas sp. TaxID=1871086 RepID=UPI00272FBD20|nr:DUF445 domain-containing protein [Brevundimonas sp.]MDP1912448.1 DUF445 domain-containing protein [Brevundimonas sp.]
MNVMSASDKERRAAMQRMKRLALGLLVFVAIVFVIARSFEDDHSWVGYVRAFSEAAMVGALADWFAVTALFRHPLGIPIPHTAIIPHRKDQIGESLGQFVQENFLTRDVLQERLAHADVGQRLGVWLSEPVNAQKAGAAVADALKGSLEVIDDRDVGSALEGMIERKVRSTPVAPLLGRAIDLAMEGGHHQRLLDAILTGMAGFLDDNRDGFRARLEEESPWWIPQPVDNRIFEKIYSAVHRFLDDVGGNSEHEMRRSIDARVQSFAARLREDPVLMAKGEELKNELLEHRDVRAWLESLWGEVKRTTLTATDDPNSELRQRLDLALVRLGARLRDEPELQQKIDDWVQRALGYVVDHYRGEVAEIISSTVEKWDGKATAERLELQVGRDLQFIRINGTLVGGLVGIVIHTVSQMLG